jgi:hypothetical protein
MAYIKTLKENELTGGIDNTDVYPVTSTQAIYCQDSQGKVPKGRKPKLEDRLEDIENSLGNSSSFEGVLYGSYKVINVTQSMEVSENPTEGTEIDVIYTNNTDHEIILTITASAQMKTPLANNIMLIIPSGGYCEANYSNINGTIYVRGM